MSALAIRLAVRAFRSHSLRCVAGMDLLGSQDPTPSILGASMALLQAPLSTLGTAGADAGPAAPAAPAPAPAPVKRKRGRPPKNRPKEEGAVEFGGSSAGMSQQQQQPQQADQQLSPPAKRGRGRPPGSKNKSTASWPQVQQAATAIVPHVVVINNGEDILARLRGLCRSTKRSLVVLAALGSVSKATLVQAGAVEGADISVTLQGHLALMSLTGAMLQPEQVPSSFPAASVSSPSGKRAGELIVRMSASLANPAGGVVGGTVGGGSLEASGPVLLVVGHWGLANEGELHSQHPLTKRQQSRLQQQQGLKTEGLSEEDDQEDRREEEEKQQAEEQRQEQPRQGQQEQQEEQQRQDSQPSGLPSHLQLIPTSDAPVSAVAAAVAGAAANLLPFMPAMAPGSAPVSSWMPTQPNWLSEALAAQQLQQQQRQQQQLATQ